MSAVPTLRDWIRERPYALALSSGFFGFFAHTGLMTVLEDEGLLPVRLSGSSAGALVAGLWASGVDAARIREELHLLRREHFWDPGLGIGLLRGRLFRERLESILATRTFAGCRAPLAISVYDVLRAPPVSSPTVTSRRPSRPRAVLPFLFHPVWHEGRPLLDGGIADRPGILGLLDGERVLHHHLASRSPWRAPGSASMDAGARRPPGACPRSAAARRSVSPGGGPARVRRAAARRGKRWRGRCMVGSSASIGRGNLDVPRRARYEGRDDFHAHDLVHPRGGDPRAGMWRWMVVRAIPAAASAAPARRLVEQRRIRRRGRSLDHQHDDQQHGHWGRAAVHPASRAALG